MPDLREQLQTLFGLDDFRPAQRGVIENVLAGRDVLCVMPTGAGKSLCFQLPAAVSGRLTIVVSPLLSLMEDQVQQLRDQGIPAAVLNSSLSAAQQRQAIAELEEGFAGLLYVAPERFFLAGFAELAAKLKPALLAIDEAHCISQWGHDFRPEYHRLGEVRKILGNPTTIALTATATDDVRADIIHQLQLNRPEVVITGFDRPTLRYECRRVAKTAEKDDQLIDLIRAEPGSCIVYCATRKNVEQVNEMLSRELRDRSIFMYHAGMEMTARTRSQEGFMQSPSGVAVATNAFGMGINKPNVRLVVHYNIPGTLEAYYQEAGRAGRDGLPARCVLLFSFQDKYIQDFFISKIGEDSEHGDAATIEEIKEHARRKLEIVISYAQTHRCRRQMILDYFGDEAAVADCRCDACSRGAQTPPPGTAALAPETITLIRQLLSGVARCNGKFGVGTVAEMLAGGQDERLTRNGLDRLSVHGLLKPRPAKQIIAMLHRLMDAGLGRQRDPDGVKFRPVVELTPLGIEVMKGTQPPSAALEDLLPRHTPAPAKSRTRMETNIDLDPAAEERFEKLRAVRLQLARDRQLPPYCICHDSTLKLIAAQRPADAIALESVKGMGPMKISMYGEAFLAAISGD